MNSMFAGRHSTISDNSECSRWETAESMHAPQVKIESNSPKRSNEAIVQRLVADTWQVDTNATLNTRSPDCGSGRRASRSALPPCSPCLDSQRWLGDSGSPRRVDHTHRRLLDLIWEGKASLGHSPCWMRHGAGHTCWHAIGGNGLIRTLISACPAMAACCDAQC